MLWIGTQKGTQGCRRFHAGAPTQFMLSRAQQVLIALKVAARSSWDCHRQQWCGENKVLTRNPLVNVTRIRGNWIFARNGRAEMSQFAAKANLSNEELLQGSELM